MTRPLLSVCIATYNRAQYIGETLESIIPQVTEEVEIVVIDGASTDSTCAVVEKYVKLCKQIRYIRLPKKGGVDQDYCAAVEHAQGKMCWLFPDDDLLRPGAISAVLLEASKGYGLIIVNAQVLSPDLSKTLENRRLQIDADETYEQLKFKQLFQRVVPYVSFIGCVVINRDLWLQRQKERYFGTEFIHVGVIFQAPLPAPALVIAEPYIAIRYGNSQWATRALEIWMFKWPSLIWSFEDIPQEVRQEHQITKPWQKLKHIIVFRAIGAYSLRHYLKWFAASSSPLWFRTIALITAEAPGFILNLVLLSYYQIAKADAWMTIYQLKNSKNNIISLLRQIDDEDQREKEGVCI
jgi:abequosyltransferase